MSETVLDRIKAYKLEEVAADKASKPYSAVEEEAKAAGPTREFAKSLIAATKTGYGLIAEVKKASPSKGLIRADFEPATLAKAYEAGGATCLSVLTDTPSFQGAKEYLTAARAATTLPALRKDFMYDTDVLIEVHDADELERALALKSQLLGINNRNLKTFETTLNTTRELSRMVPADRVLVSESGLNTPADLADMAQYGARTFLIGESLMRQKDLESATRTILANPLTGAM
ncbi:MAG: indole-3-glycerol-phosphate synthase [Rhodobacteraceae bacterium]|nr:indole-3-glycerol-phosphate synthase [Paracoccaceae bacterium]